MLMVLHTAASHVVGPQVRETTSSCVTCKSDADAVCVGMQGRQLLLGHTRTQQHHQQRKLPTADLQNGDKKDRMPLLLSVPTPASLAGCMQLLCQPEVLSSDVAARSAAWF